MKVFAVLILLVVVGGAVYMFSGAYDVSASNPDPQWKRWILSRVSDASIEKHAKDIAVPPLGAKDQLVLGFHHYDRMCAGCHGAPGAAPSELSKGLNPRAPKFSRGTDLSPAEFFWVTKHGIQMTGMPAWGSTHTDEQMWAITAFVRQLDKVTPEQYRAMQQADASPR